jgi:hypothetical protein
VEAADVLPLLDEALVALSCGLLFAGLPAPCSDGARRIGNVNSVSYLFGLWPWDRVSQGRTLVQKELLQQLGEVMQEVPAVGDMSRLRSAIVNTFPADGGAITAYHFQAGVPTEPSRYGLRRVPFEKIHYPVALEVHQDSSGDIAFPETEVIHAQHPHVLGFGTEGPADTIQEGVGAHEQTQLTGEPGSRFTSESESDPL